MKGETDISTIVFRNVYTLLSIRLEQQRRESAKRWKMNNTINPVGLKDIERTPH